MSAAVSTAAQARPHPVWGTPAPEVARYIRLLQYLCGEELNRLRVWTDPLKHADSARQLPVVRSTSWLSRSCGGSSCWPASEPGKEQQAAPRSKVAWGELPRWCCVDALPIKILATSRRCACMSQSVARCGDFFSYLCGCDKRLTGVCCPMLCLCCRCVGRSMCLWPGRWTLPWR
jgi:hypothetical protein